MTVRAVDSRPTAKLAIHSDKIDPKSFQIFKPYTEFELHHSFTPRSGKHLKRSKSLREIWICMIDDLQIRIQPDLYKAGKT